jgi:hypothetical protein
MKSCGSNLFSTTEGVKAPLTTTLLGSEEVIPLHAPATLGWMLKLASLHGLIAMLT